jgi:hypothetical protein
VLGALNGLAQTLSSAGRALGPVLAGGLFTLAARVPRGDVLAWSVFAAVAACGFLASWGIRGRDLESDWDGADDGDGDGDDDDAENATAASTIAGASESESETESESLQHLKR